MSTDITSIAHVIQLAVAPVFLLSGIAALLNVLNNRLSRIVDRARQPQNEFPSAAPMRTQVLRVSLRRLAARARLVSWSISLCTLSAIMMSSVVIALFTSAALGGNVRIAITAVDDQHGPRASVLPEDRPVGRLLDVRADTDGGDEGSKHRATMRSNCTPKCVI